MRSILRRGSGTGRENVLKRPGRGRDWGRDVDMSRSDVLGGLIGVRSGLMGGRNWPEAGEHA